ncbi:NDP-sugar synthase [candidate division KSB1 bacterium]
MVKEIRPALAVLAAGMGQRYGGLKQADPIHGGHTLLEYTIYDALATGFGKVVLLIRKDFEAEFQEVFGKKIEAGAARFDADVSYAYQESVTDVQKRLPFREKMWGTGHATLCFRDSVKEPAAVVNADDYYGRDSFRALYEFFNDYEYDVSGNIHSLIGYVLNNVVSPYGSVARGLCETTPDKYLRSVTETKNIHFDGSEIFTPEENKKNILDKNTLTSMNIWGLNPSIFRLLEKKFELFLNKVTAEKDPVSEFYLSNFIGDEIAEGRIKVKILPTAEKWFGMTYKEDRPVVRDSIGKLIKKGIYPENLWG